MRRFAFLLGLLACAATPLLPRHGDFGCGTTRESTNETRFLHRQSMRARGLRPLAVSAGAANRDIGNIAIIEDSDGVVARRNQFSLDYRTLTFTPNGATYRYSVAYSGYDAAAASAGSPLAALGDDDTRQVTLPFAFPFFGAAYESVFINSDGNLTFTAGDNASTDRSLGRMTAGPPRIAPLFDDLDPSRVAGGVRVLREPTRVVVSWVSVPEWASSGLGGAQTFQARLYPGGRIEFAYSGITAANAVTGIAPGYLKGTTSVVSFVNDGSGDYSGAVAERFAGDLAIDIAMAAQRFYQTHEDAYDYLMIYNNEDIEAMSNAVAFESTVRSGGSGYGDTSFDIGTEFGSASRLQSVINMGHLRQYRNSQGQVLAPDEIVPRRRSAGDTPVTILAHEAGHLFLAYASVRDPGDPTARPMLNTDLAHWSFVLNSEASLLEGERIEDRGTAVSPRFLTTDTVQGYSPLDRYLMGFGPAEEVNPMFLVTGVPSWMLSLHPIRGYGFDGTRRDISIDEIVQAEGRRTPDYTVAQHRFRFGFILVVAQGSTPTAEQLTQVESYRAAFEEFFQSASANAGSADSSLARSMTLSLSPAAGVVAGTGGSATLTVATPPATDMPVRIETQYGYARFPTPVTIPAGAKSAGFTFSGARAGVEEVRAVPPAGSGYEIASARLQVAEPSLLKLLPVSGTNQVPAGAAELPDPVVVRLTDVNDLAYIGTTIRAVPSAGGSVRQESVATDEKGRAAFYWTPGAAPANELEIFVEKAPSVKLAVGAGPAAPVATAVVNAASWAAQLAPGTLGAVTGANLAGGKTLVAAAPWPESLGGVSVQLNGSPLPLLYASDAQINFYLPANAAQGDAVLTVLTPSGARATVPLTVQAVAPGLFPGAVLHAGTATSAVTTAVSAGDYIEIYCTGLGPTTKGTDGLDRTTLAPTVFIGAMPADVVYSGLAPGYTGLYQVNARVPAGLAPGNQPLNIYIGQAHSNEITITVQ